MFFHSLFISLFLTCMFSFCLKNFFNHVLQGRSTDNKFSQVSSFVFKQSYSPLFLKENLSRYRILESCLFSINISMSHFTPFLITWFLMGVCCNPYPCTSIGKVGVVLLWILSRFSLCLWFSAT